MIMRLKLYRLFLKIGIYLLPFPAFQLGWWIWIELCETLNRPSSLLLRMGISARSCSERLFGRWSRSTIALQTSMKSFGKGPEHAPPDLPALPHRLFSWPRSISAATPLFPRGLLVCDILTLLLLTILLKAALRILCRSRAHLAKPTRLLIVGADQFASTAAARLQRLSFAPCEVAGFVRLPGQEVCVTGHRIYEFEQLGGLNVRTRNR